MYECAINAHFVKENEVNTAIPEFAPTSWQFRCEAKFLRSAMLSLPDICGGQWIMKAKRTRNVLTTSQSQESNESDLPDKQKARLTAILGGLQQTGSVAVDELSTRLDVSLVTIRRDLDILEQQGLLRRTHGGAVSIEPFFYEPFKNDRSFQAQVERLAEEKRRIGRAAASLIERGETVALTPGTTTTEVIRGLPLNHEITVVTNTVNVAMELSKRKDLKIFVTGGHLHGDWFSLVGPTAVQSLSQILITTVFLGADGLDAKWGASCFSPDEAHLNSVMVRHARRRIAVVDHSKLGKVAGWRICPTSDLNILVTDAGAPAVAMEPFEKANLKILQV
jgi:DeoR family transcriptional regulator of aga operon